ncbi:PIG-L deacetylase family protein [Pseudoalteromonas denitrificans]|uniref:N-acetylglucosaminyl deacetylase, LmbE family n=1 Tax=Pseudoalteromonas denitrificans DSM 6059 TaxID=1123010 RepID=A0A1I1P485_9GAMM|nr:PIG-L family deacetylase [Pseudoalteromonas denitrificans]SFD04751.1 N-acetylglucosaminyl deacetylase, LmbE family [Pseudoalteromonas denitrificans DSM 6059]
MKLTILVIFMLFICSCQNVNNNTNIIAVFAHPDDETWISGTLAKLASQGLNVTPIYLTSGDKGRDLSGSKLSGAQLAIKRESEAINACQVLGLSSPIFLRFPDGKVHLNQIEVKNKLHQVIHEKKPMAIFTFEAQGITGNRDHRFVSKIVRTEFDNKVISFAVSQNRANKFYDYAKKHAVEYKIKNPILDSEVFYQIDVGAFHQKRVEAMSQYKTQFPMELVSAFSDFAKEIKVEELTSPPKDPSLSYFKSKYLLNSIIAN